MNEAEQEAFLQQLGVTEKVKVSSQVFKQSRYNRQSRQENKQTQAAGGGKTFKPHSNQLSEPQVCRQGGVMK